MTSQQPGSPSGLLEKFPSYLLRKGVVLFRAHAITTGPIWYSSSDIGFGNLPKPFGTLHLASDLNTAVSELLGPAGGQYRSVTVRQSLGIQVSRLTVIRSIRLANLSHDRAADFGLTPFALAEPDAPEAIRRWMSAFHRAGFNGAIYRSRYDTGNRNTGVAIFGGAGVPARADVTAGGQAAVPGPAAAIAAGFHVLPHQTRAHLDIIK